jgi:predicted phage terminase large subunit-like protein
MQQKLKISSDWLARQLERAQSALAAKSLIEFTLYTQLGYKAGPFHRLVAKHLDRVIAGKEKRLMIFAPPQHGKTMLASESLPAYWLGHRPDDPVILSSYAASLAHRNSRHVRTIVESDKYGRVFNTKIKQDSRAVELWEIENGRGALRAAGVGGGIAGNPVMLGIIDDPVASWQEAQSQTYRNRAWDWWQHDFYPRIWENGAVVVIQTRWHEDDLSGRILAHEANKWTVLRCPALAETQKQRDFHNQRMGLAAGLPDPLNREPGQALVPSRFSKVALHEIRETVGQRVWGALYQGAPMALEGNRIKREWLTKFADAIPQDVRGRTRYWDFAATADGGKRTAGVRISIDLDGIIYIEDVVFGQWSTDARNRVVKQTAEMDHAQFGNYGDMWVEKEPGSSGVDAINALVKFMAGFAVQPDTVTGDKDTRLEPFAAQAEAGNVRIVRANWNAPFVEELCAVPNGQFRDMADATAGGYNKLSGGAFTVVNLGQAIEKWRRENR